MAGTKYTRDDFVVRIDQLDDRAHITFGPEGSPSTKELLGEKSLTSFWLNNQETFRSINEALRRWESTREPEEAAQGEESRRMRRVRVEVEHPGLRNLRWEMLSELHSGSLVVRALPGRPSYWGRAVVPPLQIVQVGNGPDLWDLMHTMPGGLWRTREAYLPGLVIRRMDREEFGALQARRGRADVVVINEWPPIQLDSRVLERTGTRLVVISGSPHPGPRWRGIADEENAASPALAFIGPDPQALELFLLAVLHDQPLDVALSEAFPSIATWWPYPFLLAGGGREESLRVSALADLLSAEAARANSGSLESSPHTSLSPAVQHALQEAMHKRTEWNFDDREGGGLLPMAAALSPLRNALRAERDQTPEAPRVVLADLRDERDGAPTARDPKRDGPISLDGLVHLAVHIGEQVVDGPTLEARPLIESLIQWDDDQQGAWLDVAIAPLDFTLRGAAQRALWLPRKGGSEVVLFGMVPSRAGVCSVRYIVYQGNHVLQSGKLAVVVADPADAVPAAPDVASLARALGYEGPPEALKGRWYASRPEFGTRTLSERDSERKAPALSLVANDHEDETVISVKGGDNYKVERRFEMKEALESLRAAIERHTAPPPGTYRFTGGRGGVRNAADDKDWSEGLRALAVQGWSLYDKLFSDEIKRNIDASLKLGGRVEVAQLVLDKGIPWAFVYDRPYDPECESHEGHEVEQLVCNAGLDDLRPIEVPKCGVHAGCPLRESNLEALRRERKPLPIAKTVVCPWHFWGFRHELELAPRHLDDACGGDPRREIVVQGQPTGACGIHPGMQLEQQHTRELIALSRSALIRWDPPEPLNDRDPLLARMERDGAILYVYCHVDFVGKDPKLVVCRQKGKRGIKPADVPSGSAIQGLVFLNGCDTAAGPAVVAPFVLKFVRDRSAAGVVGTEAKVCEVLAGEAAEIFLKCFLHGDTAGASLRTMRREFLARRNPFGLVYTLYADFELRIVVHP